MAASFSIFDNSHQSFSSELGLRPLSQIFFVSDISMQSFKYVPEKVKGEIRARNNQRYLLAAISQKNDNTPTVQYLHPRIGQRIATSQNRI